MSVSKVEAYPSGALYSVHVKGKLLSLTTNIRLSIRGDKPLQSILISESEVEAYPSGALYSVHFKSKLLSLTTYTGLSRIGYTETNTLAIFSWLSVTKKKKFYIIDTCG
jgi:hypothetical protein